MAEFIERIPYTHVYSFGFSDIMMKIRSSQ